MTTDREGAVSARGPERCVRVVVRGRVQGVAFRAHTAEAARGAGVTGWVRNRDDGAVEALFEGHSAAIETMLAFVRRGPRFARVDGVEVHEERPMRTARFEIRA
jgi:acylphosphatase